MKSLVVDAAASCMAVAAKNDDRKAALILDIGQKQSQKLLSAIVFALSEVGLAPDELDYSALTSGPGTFTGLRLAFSALKAIELAHNIPIYGVPSLDVYAFPFRAFDGKVISVIDAKKDQFFAAVYENGVTVSGAEDTTAERVAQKLGESVRNLLCGPDAAIFAEQLKKINQELKLTVYPSQPPSTDALFALAEEMIAEGKNPLADYDGPVYLRKSEAELKLESSQRS